MKTSRYLLLVNEAAFVMMLCCNINLNACTGIYIRTKHLVLVGNNEDGANPNTKVWFVPGKGNKYGRMYVGYDDLSAQGGVNEKGLWFDAFGLPHQEFVSNHGEIYPGDLQDKLMAECATVGEVLKMLDRFSRSPMTRYQWMFGDRRGNSVIIEGDAIIPIKGRYQVITNFRQSIHPSGKGYECERYRIANSMLQAQPDVRLNDVRRILAATHSEGQDVTLYSYIAALKRGVMYLYHFHNFENVVVFDIRKELAKGQHILNLPELFPKTNAAESFYYHVRTELAAKKSARRDTTFDATTYADYCGRFVIGKPEILARQTITITAGASQLYFQLNDGGKLEVLPDSPTSFFLLNYGGMDFSCRFTRDSLNKADALILEGGGLNVTASIVK